MKDNDLKIETTLLGHIGLGCASFGNVYQLKMTQNQCNIMVQTSYNAGIRFFDTAPWYGGGLSEERLGHAFKSAKIPRENLFVSTKVCRYTSELMFDYSCEKMDSSFKQSLKLLQTDYVDLLIAHDVEFSGDPLLISSQVLPYLQQLKNSKLTKCIGISGYSLEFLKSVVEASSITIDYVMTYARYTLVDTSLMDYYSFFQKFNVKIIAASLTGMGLLTKQGPPPWHPASKQLKEMCLEIANYCQETNKDISDICYNFVFGTSNNIVDYFLLGTSTPQELYATLNSLTTSILNPDYYQNELKHIFEKILRGEKNYNWENLESIKYKGS